jgi:hypothetical protein
MITAIVSRDDNDTFFAGEIPSGRLAWRMSSAQKNVEATERQPGGWGRVEFSGEMGEVG